MTRFDKMLIGLLLFVGIAGYAGVRWFFGQQPAGLIVTRANGKVTSTTSALPTGKSQLIAVSGPLGESQVEIDGGRVHMLNSPCPDKTCVKMGWIERSGQTVICIPNQVIIAIESPTGDEFDGISQ